MNAGFDLKINFQDTLGPRLLAFSDERLQSRLTNFVLARVGRKFRTFQKQRYLSGNPINGGSGSASLSGRIRVYKKRSAKNVYIVGEKTGKGDGYQRVKLANIFEHEGGYTVRPKEKKALRFIASDGTIVFTKKAIHVRERHFMSEPYEAFNWDSTFTAKADAVFDKELAKAGLK